MSGILIVDDYADWRRQLRFLLQARPEWQIICEASDGLEAVKRAEELRPDLILLDIGLPNLNGIEAARQIRKLVTNSKILFLSQESDADIVQEALNLGSGYVLKASAGKDLVPAMEAVLQGEQFVSSDLAGRDPLSARAKSVMHFHFEFDPENKIFQCKFHGPVTSESLKQYYRTAACLVAASHFRSSITDFSGATSFDVTAQAVRELAALPPMPPIVSRLRVIVAPSALIFGLARLFQMIGKATRPNLHVVWNTDQAFALLGVATPKFSTDSVTT